MVEPGGQLGAVEPLHRLTCRVGTVQRASVSFKSAKCTVEPSETQEASSHRASSATCWGDIWQRVPVYKRVMHGEVLAAAAKAQTLTIASNWHWPGSGRTS